MSPVNMSRRLRDTRRRRARPEAVGRTASGYAATTPAPKWDWSCELQSSTATGDHPAAGQYDGHEGFREVLGRAKELTGGRASFEPLAVVNNDEDTLMVWGIFRGERNGITFETHHAYYYRFVDGQIVEGHTIPADQTAANAFWSS